MRDILSLNIALVLIKRRKKKEVFIHKNKRKNSGVNTVFKIIGRVEIILRLL